MSDVVTETPPAVRKIPWGQLAVFVLVFGLLVLVALQMRRNGPLAASQVGAGSPAPRFEITTFDSQTYKLADLRGKVVVVNFWASWCVPCADEAAELESTWQHYKDQGVVFLGVDYVDTETAARAYLQRLDITYPNGPDLGTRISQAYRIKGVPETYIVDQTGKLASVKIGPFQQGEMAGVIEPLLNR